ncbi:hypothetical protein J2808_004517 [Pseudarthrobacter sulfonivorans]|nr:hypothetical protein [Pseudarthrobacter sulfonivorans]
MDRSGATFQTYPVSGSFANRDFGRFQLRRTSPTRIRHAAKRAIFRLLKKGGLSLFSRISGGDSENNTPTEPALQIHNPTPPPSPQKPRKHAKPRPFPKHPTAPQSHPAPCSLDHTPPVRHRRRGFTPCLRTDRTKAPPGGTTNPGRPQPSTSCKPAYPTADGPAATLFHQRCGPMHPEAAPRPLHTWLSALRE